METIISKHNDKNRTNKLISEIRDIVDSHVAERQSLALITAKLAELIAIFNRQSTRIQWGMTFLTGTIALMTFVLIILSIAMISKM